MVIVIKVVLKDESSEEFFLHYLSEVTKDIQDLEEVEDAWLDDCFKN